MFRKVSVFIAPMVKRFHAIILGRVQGVFYRAMAREHAEALGLQGFAKNLPDGSVELDAQGEEESLCDFLRWCQHGPPGARVDDVEVDWKPPQESSGGFQVR
jgi:acylphosphatase